MILKRFLVSIILLLSVISTGNAQTITDGLGRSVAVPDRVERIICSGSGCLRLATYLQLSDRVVAVDSIEKKLPVFEARPYSIARSEYANLPLFGEFRGNDSEELILSLDPSPQVIFKTGCTIAAAQRLQDKTGIPVVALNYGNLLGGRKDLYNSIRIMGGVMDADVRASQIVSFFNATIEDLKARSASSSFSGSCYVGGVAFRGPHGIVSTEPAYPPFAFVGVQNVAAQGRGASAKHATVDKEALLRWNPDVLFIDLSTITASDGGSIRELKEDPLWKGLSAVQNNQVFGLLPYNWYTQNFGNILADAYFVGKTLCPDGFKDVELSVKADEIYTFLVGEPVFEKLNRGYENLAFTKLNIGN